MNDQFLATPSRPDIADLTPADAAALGAAAGLQGFAVFELDGASMRTKPELMDHAALKLAFPGDFGKNWDAMVDYLGDMATIHKNSKILIFVRAPEKIGSSDPRLRADLLKVFGFACDNAREWSKHSVILKFALVWPDKCVI